LHFVGADVLDGPQIVALSAFGFGVRICLTFVGADVPDGPQAVAFAAFGSGYEFVLHL
jgi:hypothetical protein